MKVSLTWLAVVLIGISLLFLGVQAKGVYEAFQDKVVHEGFLGGNLMTDIKISTCPAKAGNPHTDANGRKICCNGPLVDGECPEENRICSLTETVDGIPMCSAWLAGKLNNKGRDICPTSMPNYYETTDESVRGCSAGDRKPDGTGPLDSKMRFCRLYKTKEEENKNKDSCSNQMILESAKCGDKQTKELVWERRDGKVRPYVLCSYTYQTGTGPSIQKTCAITTTYRDFQNDYRDNVDRSYIPDYIQGSDSTWKDYFCPVAKKIYLDKSVPVDHARFLDVFTGAYRQNPPPPPAPPTPPPPPPPPPPQDRIESGKCITNPLCLPSKNGRYKLCQQGDGNTVVYDGNTPIWASNRQGSNTRLCMQDDGNLVSYSGNTALWASQTTGQGQKPFRAVMQDDGNFVIYDGSGKATWASKTPKKCVFDATEYENFYSDLKDRFKGNKDELKKHWIENGMREGRSPCGAIKRDCKFTVQGYMDANSDVKDAYKGMTGQTLIDNVTGHYKVYGINEGRPVCPS